MYNCLTSSLIYFHGRSEPSLINLFCVEPYWGLMGDATRRLSRGTIRRLSRFH